MGRHEWLREHLRPILAEDMSLYWLSYQLVNSLRNRAPNILDQLESDYGTGYGRNGGAQYRPDTAISHCLSDWAQESGVVDVQWLCGQGLRVCDVEATDNMAIFRWIG